MVSNNKTNIDSYSRKNIKKEYKLLKSFRNKNFSRIEKVLGLVILLVRIDLI